MGRPSKKNLPPAKVMGFLADNVKKLRDRKYDAALNETAKNRLLAKASSTSLSQVQRVIVGHQAVGVDIVERLAESLDARPADLLTPYFANSVLATLAAQAHQDADRVDLPNKNRRGSLQIPTS